MVICNFSDELTDQMNRTVFTFDFRSGFFCRMNSDWPSKYTLCWKTGSVKMSTLMKQV